MYKQNMSYKSNQIKFSILLLEILAVMDIYNEYINNIIYNENKH